MSNQTDRPSSTATAGRDTNSSKHGIVASVLTFFSSSGLSGDWIMYFVITGFLELIRRFFIFAWKSLANQLWITMVLEEYDDSYGKSDLSLLV